MTTIPTPGAREPKRCREHRGRVGRPPPIRARCRRLGQTGEAPGRSGTCWTVSTLESPMTTPDRDEDRDEDRDGGSLDAGEFSAWITSVEDAMRNRSTSDVPCGTCTACCTSGQFIHIGPDEKDTLAHIAPELLFSAPQRPPGHVLLGYDERGHCPMLIEGRCSIYEHRPRTCRTYDCRVFAAAGVVPEHPTLAPIARQVGRWRFDYPTGRDRARHRATSAAAAFLRDHAAALPGGPAPANDTQIAVLAVRIHDLFLDDEKATPPDDSLIAEISRRLVSA